MVTPLKRKHELEMYRSADILEPKDLPNLPHEPEHIKTPTHNNSTEVTRVTSSTVTVADTEFLEGGGTCVQNLTTRTNSIEPRPS